MTQLPFPSLCFLFKWHTKLQENNLRQNVETPASLGNNDARATKLWRGEGEIIGEAMADSWWFVFQLGQLGWASRLTQGRWGFGPALARMMGVRSGLLFNGGAGRFRWLGLPALHAWWLMAEALTGWAHGCALRVSERGCSGGRCRATIWQGFLYWFILYWFPLSVFLI